MYVNSLRLHFDTYNYNYLSVRLNLTVAIWKKVFFLKFGLYLTERVRTDKCIENHLTDDTLVRRVRSSVAYEPTKDWFFSQQDP